jgi:hypothetical protein
MKKKSSPQTPKGNLPISKQTAGGVAGAVVGSAVAGPVGAVVGAIAGTIMGNRSAQGKSLVSSGTVKSAKKVADTAGKKVPALKAGLKSTVSKGKALTKTAKAPASKAAKTKPAKAKASKPAAAKSKPAKKAAPAAKKRK